MKDLIFSPSEFAFGYSSCKRCYYDLKIDNLRVSTPFPSIFSKLDRLQKEFYHEKSTDILNAKRKEIENVFDQNDETDTMEPNEKKIIPRGHSHGDRRKSEVGFFLWDVGIFI